MKLYRIILPVTDIEKAVSFYSDILGIEGVRVSPGRHYFNLQGTILACYDPVADGDEIKTQWVFHENQYIYIATPNLDKIFEKIRKSNCLYVDDKISSMPWGERLFYVNDPFKNPICFVDETTIFTGD
ncbi:VOC family protein [Tenacibaculum caenipelagi]|uniref:Glyoxalase/bleomycin resistance protein/dioxygenase superfamily protein n=1 Tax=Tenacibaculum caenipelagi TaxID=1325435 RepID=A0A4R6TIN2_9FLAO|nr:VOC family protein [Tenacibaculum caenipelagi]TDQ29981.1 glyoxalase/bleomycin resistance protein/dioxygenase superfamily protein [Tenacibaculum caenipelagi]